MIGEALGDTPARLRAFDTPPEVATQSAPEPRASVGEQRDDVARECQRSDLESGTL